MKNKKKTITILKFICVGFAATYGILAMYYLIKIVL